MKDPAAIQQQWLGKLIEKASNTEWGQKHNFKDITNLFDFSESIKLNDYEALKPYIQRMMMGEKDILWPGRIKWFSKSSGTTNDKSKFIPVSDENLHQCHLKGSHDTIALWLNSNPNTKMFNGKGLVMGGSLKEFSENNETLLGDVSAIMLNNMPFYAKYFHTPSVEIALMSEWESKIEKMAHHIVKENLTSISGVPTWTIVLFRRILELSGKKTYWKFFQILNSTCTVESHLLHTSNSLEVFYHPILYNTVKSIMLRKVSLVRNTQKMTMACFCCSTMVFIMNFYQCLK